MTKEPILITGIHRSGSTWIGKTISTSSEVKYIQEPFNTITKWANPLRKLKIYTRKTPIKYLFEYIDSNSSKKKQEATLSFVKGFYIINLKTIVHELAQIRNISDINKAYHEITSRNKRPLLKDPIAILSSEFLQKELNCKVIISIRHPAAFISSLIKMNWGFDFNNLLNQKELINTHLYKYKPGIEFHCQNECNLIDQGILLWNIIYDFVSELKDKYENSLNWYFIKHEDISQNPIVEFEKIFHFLDLKLTERIKNEIIVSTSGRRIDDLNRNSRDNIKSWKNILNKKELNTIREKTYNVAKRYYSDDSWQ